MCLYPKLILNKKYLPTKKNGYKPPIMTDGRVKYVPVGCGKCIECKKQKAQGWRVRLLNELQNNKYAYFITLTFAPEELDKLCTETKLKESNAIAGIAVRRFLERWRKANKHSIKHWLITELGHENTERIHLHGILFSEKSIDNTYLTKMWKYGRTDTGQYCNEQSINYIVKYVTKTDQVHKNFEAQIFSSAGIGKKYIETGKRQNYYDGENTKEYYKLPNGTRIGLPIYYRNHIYTEEEREKLWCMKLDEDKRWVMGIPIENASTQAGNKRYEQIREEQRKLNRLCGYGDDSNEWRKHDYNITLRHLQKETRKKKELQNLSLRNNKTLNNAYDKNNACK